MMHPPNPAKAPWYFLGLQELVSYSAFWGGVGIPDPRGARCCCSSPYLDREAGRRRQVVRPRAPARQHAVRDVRPAERDLHRHRHVLPRTELGVRRLRGEEEAHSMRLALAIASLVILIVHGIVFYDQFFHQWERHQTAYFEQARTPARRPTPSAPQLEARAPRIEQIIVTSSARPASTAA